MEINKGNAISPTLVIFSDAVSIGNHMPAEIGATSWEGIRHASWMQLMRQPSNPSFMEID